MCRLEGLMLVSQINKTAAAVPKSSQMPRIDSFGTRDFSYYSIRFM